MNLRGIDDAYETATTSLEFAPATTQVLTASNSEPAVLNGLNQQLGQGSQGGGSGSNHESDDNKSLAFGTELKSLSEAAQSYEPPT